MHRQWLARARLGECCDSTHRVRRLDVREIELAVLCHLRGVGTQPGEKAIVHKNGFAEAIQRAVGHALIHLRAKNRDVFFERWLNVSDRLFVSGECKDRDSVSARLKLVQ